MHRYIYKEKTNFQKFCHFVIKSGLSTTGSRSFSDDKTKTICHWQKIKSSKNASNPLWLKEFQR